MVIFFLKTEFHEILRKLEPASRSQLGGYTAIFGYRIFCNFSTNNFNLK